MTNASSPQAGSAIPRRITQDDFELIRTKIDDLNLKDPFGQLKLPLDRAEAEGFHVWMLAMTAIYQSPEHTTAEVAAVLLAPGDRVSVELMNSERSEAPVRTVSLPDCGVALRNPGQTTPSSIFSGAALAPLPDRRPYWYRPFSQEVRTVLARLIAVIGDICPMSLEEAEDTFRREVFLRTSLARLDVYGQVYAHITQNRQLSTGERGDVLIGCFLAGDILLGKEKVAPLGTLTARQVEEIMELIKLTRPRDIPPLTS